MKPLFIVCISIAAVCSYSVSLAQTAEILIETCNKIPDSKKRLECLKAAMNSKTTVVQPASSAPSKVPQELSVQEAADICVNVMTVFAAKRDQATEDASLSTPNELTITWPADEGKSPSHCTVNRTTKRIEALSTNDKIFTGPELNRIVQLSVENKEIDAGDFKNFVARAKASITASFKDPSSAQFQSLFVSKKSLPTLCGVVNAKNSYGAYVGFRRFYATGREGLNSVENPRDNFVFERMWPSMCDGKLADVE